MIWAGSASGGRRARSHTAGRCSAWTDLAAVARARPVRWKVDGASTAAVAGLPRGRAETILAEIGDVVAGWRGIAEEVGVEEPIAEQIARSHRLKLPAR